MHKTVLAAALAAAVSVNFGAAPAHAQQTGNILGEVALKDRKDVKDTKVQQVEVHGVPGTYDPRRDDTASKIVIGRDEIVKYGDANLLDVLKRVPGVTVSGNGGRGSEVRMRGLGGGYTQVLIDGEKTPPGFNLELLAPNLIERIEVLRVASAEYSTQAIAGTINVVLKKTIKAGRRELKVGYADSRYATGPTVSLQIEDKADTLAWSIAADVTREHYDALASTVEERFDPAGFQDRLRLGRRPERGQITRLNLTPRLIWTLENGDKLIFQTLINIRRSQIDSHTLVETQLGPPPEYPDVAEARGSVQKLLRQEVNWTHRFKSGAKLDAKVTATAAENPIARYSTGVGRVGTATLHQLFRLHNSAQGVSSVGKFTSRSWEGHALAFGWDGGYLTSPDSLRQRDYDQPDVPVPDGDQFYTANLTRLALYSQDEWTVTPQWSAYLGARWEGLRTRVEGSIFDQAAQGAVYNRSSVFSPLFQTLYKVPGTKGDQLRFALTRTYKSPVVQQLIPRRIVSVNNSQTNPDSSGNPSLKPELALGVDAGWEHFWSEGALVSVSGYVRNIDNSTSRQTVFDSGVWVSRLVNTGHARVRGLEIEAKVPLKAVIDTNTALDVRASLSRNWSSVDAIPGPNNRLLSQTPLSASLGADFKRGALTAGGSFVFKNGGEARVSASEMTYETVRRDLDLYAVWKFDDKLQLRVAGSSLLSQDYINGSSYMLEGSGIQRIRTFYPGSRVLRATLEMKF